MQGSAAGMYGPPITVSPPHNSNRTKRHFVIGFLRLLREHGREDNPPKHGQFIQTGISE
jgi:hypothetical protein